MMKTKFIKIINSMHNKLIVCHYDGLNVLFKNMSKRENLATKFFYERYGKEYKVEITNHPISHFGSPRVRKRKLGPFLLCSKAKNIDRYIFLAVVILDNTVYIDFGMPFPPSNSVELEELFTILQNDGGLSTKTINKILKECNPKMFNARRRKGADYTHAIKIYDTYSGGRVKEGEMLQRLFFTDLTHETEFFDALSKCKKFIGFEG